MSTRERELQNQLKNMDPDEVYDALIKIGKEGLESLSPDVERFLTHREGFLRGAAIRVLAFYWQLPPYREVAGSLWRTDPEEEVQAIALMGWAQYSDGSKDPAVLRDLLSILWDTDAAEYLRVQSWVSLLSVAAIPREEYPPLARYGYVDEDVDWGLVERIESDLPAG